MVQNSKTVQIRKMIKTDIAEVVLIERECFSVPWSEQAFCDALELDNAYYYVACVDDKIVGYCGAYGVLDEGDINQVAVTSAFRKRGIAEQLVSSMIDDLEKAGYIYITLEVRKSNVAAISLYEKLGFANEGIRKNFYEKPTEDAVIMWKR